MTALEIAMDKARIAQLSNLTKAITKAEWLGTPNPHAEILAVDTSLGMAAIFEDTPMSKPVAIVTVAFARKFCAEDPYYTWRKL